MKLEKIHLAFILLIFPLLISAQVESLFNDIRMKQSVQEVHKKVKAISGKSTLYFENTPSFPLALKREAHLVCSKIKTEQGLLSRVVFTFSDDQLTYILAKGNVFPVFTEKRIDTARVYMEYDVYFSDKLFLHKKKDLAWILTDEATHPNLFTWVNPYIDPDYTPEAKSPGSDRIPAFLKMGASMQELKAVFEKNSDFTFTEELDGSDPNAQIQINCFGVQYLGFPRKVEARFGDDKLNVVWILTGKGEEDRIRKALIDQYGQAIYVNEDWEIFDDWQVGLRKDKPEVLLMEKSIGLEYKTSYFKQ